MKFFAILRIQLIPLHSSPMDDNTCTPDIESQQHGRKIAAGVRIPIQITDRVPQPAKVTQIC